MLLVVTALIVVFFFSSALFLGLLLLLVSRNAVTKLATPSFASSAAIRAFCFVPLEFQVLCW